MANLKDKYQKIKPKLKKELGLENIWAVPDLEKVVVNMGLGEAADDRGVLEKAMPVLAAITGQKPKVTRAKKAVSGFRLRKDAPIGLKVTLRDKRMYDFIEKLFKIVLPRLRDFQGLSLKSFDGRGNYTLGLTEQIIFPEVEYEKIDKVRGLEIVFVTSTDSDDQARALLSVLGMPFKD